MIKPLFDRVLIKLEGADAVSKGGVIIPEVARERAMQQGIVVEVGKVTCVKKGDKVMLAKFAGNEIEVGKMKFVIVKEEDILAICS